MKTNKFLTKLTAIFLMVVMVVTIMPAMSLKAEDTTYTVTFAVNEQFGTSFWEEDKTVTVNAGEVIPTNEIPADPYMRNCKFVGWTTTNEWRFECEGMEIDYWDFENDTVTANTKLYPMWKLADNWWETEEDDALRTGGTDLRIMSYNVCRSFVTLKRAEQLKKVLECYQPDVVCLQEFSKADGWTDFCDSVGIDDTYTLITYESVDELYETDNVYLQFRIAYNHDKIELCKDEDGDAIIGADNFNISIGQGWAMFQMIDNPDQKFIVMGTHWSPATSASTELEVNNPERAAERVKALKNTYPSVPIITAGDYNQSPRLKSVTTRYAEPAELKLCQTDALMRGFVGVCWPHADAVSLEQNINSFTLPLSTNQTGYETIDHIFVSDDIQTLYFDTVLNEYALDNSSDHLPVYADLTFNHKYDNACDTTCSVVHEEGVACVRDIVRTHANHCGEAECQWCGGSTDSLKGAEDALAPVIKGATIRKMDEDETQSIRFECEIPDLPEGTKVTKIGMIAAYYNYIKTGKITADDFEMGASDGDKGKYFMEDSKDVSANSELSDGGIFYVNVGDVPENRYGYRFVVRVWAEYSDGTSTTTWYSSNTTMTESEKDGSIIYTGSMEDAVKVEDGLCSRSVTGIAQEMAKWIYSTGRAQEAYELDDLDEKILSSYNDRTGGTSWVKPDGEHKMTAEVLVNYLMSNNNDIIGLKEAWDLGYRGPADGSSDMILNFGGLQNDN